VLRVCDHGGQAVAGGGRPRKDQGMRVQGDIQAWPPELASGLPVEPWLVIHTKSRQEKRLADNLRAFGLSHLLFLERRSRYYPGKGTQFSLVPLLPGYMFVSAEERAMQQIYDTDRVMRILPVRRPELLFGELNDLIGLVSLATKPLIVNPQLVPGTRVTLTRGSMAGLSGVVLRRKGCYELAVNVYLLGHAVSVICSAEDVAEAVPAPVEASV
jgi:transcription antitermination factor NusG